MPLLRCATCGGRFTHLGRHRFENHVLKDEVYRCPRCSHEEVRGDSMHLHMRRAHHATVPRNLSVWSCQVAPFRVLSMCRVCGFKTSSRAAMTQHRATHPAITTAAAPASTQRSVTVTQRSLQVTVSAPQSGSPVVTTAVSSAPVLTTSDSGTYSDDADYPVDGYHTVSDRGATSVPTG